MLKHPAPNPAPRLRPASAPCLLPGVLLLLLCSCCPLVCSPFSLLMRCPAMHKRTSEPKMKSVQQRTQGRQSGYTHLADRSPCCCELACRSFTARSLLRLAARLSIVVHAQEQQQLRQIAQSRPRCRAEQAAMSDPREPTHATRTTEWSSVSARGLLGPCTACTVLEMRTTTKSTTMVRHSVMCRVGWRLLGGVATAARLAETS